ncbi:MAG: hypothetical protein ABI741_16240 [Ferruginibacter sp.]
MRKLFLLIIICTAYTFSYAQSRSSKVDYQKESRPAIENDVPFPAKTVEKAIEDTFAKLGYKGSGSKGFTVYKGVRMPELGPDAYDIYFMVDKKSRKDNENSTVTMMVTKGFDTFISESSDEKVFGKTKNYLDSLRNTVAVYDLEQQIATQEDEVKNADKKNENLQEDGKDLVKKKRKLEEAISDNIRDQERQAKEVEKQKQILQTLKGKRKQ